VITRRSLLALGALLLGTGRARGAAVASSRFGAGSVTAGKREYRGLLELGPEEVAVFEGRSRHRLKLAQVDAIVLPRRGRSEAAPGDEEELAQLDLKLRALADRLGADPTAAADLGEWIACIRHGFLSRAPIGPPIADAFWVVPDPTRHHAAHAASAFAVDLAPVDGAGRVHEGSGAANEDYAGWKRALLAVADGRVLRARDDRQDDEAWKGVADPERANELVLELEGGQAFYQHLLAGSLEVRPGDEVKRGDVLARIGNSGNATWPHLHFALYEHIGAGPGSGSLSVPVALEACRVTGLRERARGKAGGLDLRCENAPLQEGWVLETPG